jgi:hypothetical protein
MLEKNMGTNLSRVTSRFDTKEQEQDSDTTNTATQRGTKILKSNLKTKIARHKWL